MVNQHEQNHDKDVKMKPSQLTWSKHGGAGNAWKVAKEVANFV